MHFLLLLLLCAPLFAQPFPPDSVWTFHYDNGGDEFFYDAIEVEDGYLLCGESREWNAQAGVALLVKIDFTGQLVWERTYPEERFRRFRALFHENLMTLVHGEYLLASGQSVGLFFFATNTIGDSTASHSLGFEDGRVHTWGDAMKIGQTAIACVYNARRSNQFDDLYLQIGFQDPELLTRENYYCHSINILGSGTFVVAGRYEDGSGSVQGFVSYAPYYWVPTETWTFGGDGEDEFLAGLDREHWGLPDIIVGRSSSSASESYDMWVFRYEYDFGLDSVWSRYFGGLAYEDGVEIVEGTDEGFIIAGNFSSEDINFEQSDFWLLKVDDNGDSVWSVLAGGEESDHCEGMIETQNGYLLFGNSMSFTAPGWDGCAMFLGYVPDLAVSPNQLNFGPTQVGDSTLRTLSLINTGSNLLTVSEVIGNEVYHPHFLQSAQIEVGDTFDVEVYFAPTANGNYIDTLEVRSDAISGTKYIRVLGAGIGGSAANETPLPLEFRLHSAFPNPFNASTQFTLDLPHASHINLSIFDIQGRLQSTLNNSELPAGSHTFAFDASNRAAGLYFLRATSAEFTTTQKLVLLK